MTGTTNSTTHAVAAQATTTRSTTTAFSTYSPISLRGAASAFLSSRSSLCQVQQPRLASSYVVVPPRRLQHPAILACLESSRESPRESPSESPAESALDSSLEAPRKSPPRKQDEEEEQLDEAAMRAAEIHEVLTGLQEFKTRIIDDATKLAKKVRASKKQLKAALESHPDILKIDGHIEELEEELRILGDR